MISRRALLICLLTTLASCRLTPKPPACPTSLRAVFDVGSGTTKLNLSEVAVCADEVRLVRTIDDRTTKSVPLEATKDEQGEISAAGLIELKRAVTDLRDHAFETARRLAPKYGSIDFAAAGTHAFRTCRNQPAVVAVLADLGVPIVALSQAQEATLAFDGAAARVEGCQSRAKITWDIGGGSMQFTRADGTFRGLPVGAEGFKSAVIQEFGLSGIPKCDAKIESANPVGVHNLEKAIALAATRAGVNRDPAWRDLTSACVIGVGGLHARAVLDRIHANWPVLKTCVCPKGDCRPTEGAYSRKEVECLAETFASKRDCDVEIRGPYSGMGATNPILIAGLMRALKITAVHVVDVNMGQALVLDRDRLTFRRQPIPKLTAP